MAVVSKVATLTLSGATGNRTWVATAAVQDTAAGSSVVITCTESASGVTPPGAADTLTLDVRIDNGATLVRSFALTSGTASQTVTLFLTSDGTNTGPARCGTLRMVVHAVKTTGGATVTYNVDTDLTNNTPPTGFSATVHDQGWIRGSTTAATVLPSTGTLAYGDTLTATTTLGAAPFQSQTLKVALSPTLSAVTSSASTTATFSTALGSVDNRFPVAATSEISATTFPNATLATSSPWTTATLTETTRTVDPRLSFTHLLQVNDNTFGTPPSSKNVASRQRLTSDLGFLSARVTNANAVGINGIAWTTTLQDHAHLTGALTATPTSTTQGGEDGWGNAFLTWSSTLPTGQWDKTSVISSPAGAVGLEANNSATYTLVAANPNLRIICGGGPATVATDTKHFTPGAAFIVGLIVFNVLTMATVTLDVGTPSVFIGRLNLATGKAEYLDSDGITWLAATGASIYGHPLTVSPADANLFTKTFTTVQTANWGTADVFVVGKCTVGGVPVNDFAKEIVVSGLNNHNAYVFDGAGFVGFPSK